MASAAGNRAPGLHTPTQSFSGSPADTLTPGVAFDPMARTDKKKLKEEVDGAKQRLTDVKFNMRDYPDPLLPRDVPPERHIPQGFTANDEKALLDLVALTRISQ
ncbi:hypothetical protein KJ359_005701 [Pestalotiopsis sp. 9143b]|nr:hypothetical protein KJ359_005701 [Pestalotiopsis sp. 9143b]